MKLIENIIIIFIFLLQPFFISALAINETPIPFDSSSGNKVIILMDDSEIVGNIIEQSKSSLRIQKEDGIILRIPNSKIKIIYNQDYFVKNVIYLDMASCLWVGNININYERMIHPIWSIRIGAGIGYGVKDWCFQAITLMINFLPGKMYSKFEFGIGTSYVKEVINRYTYSYEMKFNIALAIGYRYQNIYEGMLYRIGFSYLGYGGGVHLSIGYAF
ncbi:MAG: hypothetical protein EPN82_08655 [Bacteroidetes bacterium]|nr:MAG: hypothetical protein EPN82_08655 [Bacteroidota bacterium]